MNSLRMVGRSSLVLLFAGAVLTAQAGSQAPEQYPPAPGQYDPVSAPPEATDWSDDIPAHIAIVDGTATLEREGRVETAEENILLLAGDRLRTERGRVEVLFADGSALDLDHYTRLDLLSDSLVRLLDGRVRLTIARTTTALDYRVDAAAGSVSIKTPGDYRIAVRPARSGEQELDVTVLRGSAELGNALGLTLVRVGTHAAVTASTAPSLPFSANSAEWDDFDRWAEDQRDARYGTTSTRYLPEEIRSYGGSFDRYGSWDYLPTYGQVWYPNVDPGWRPYQPRTLVVRRAYRLVLGRLRSLLGLADASLRPLGLWLQPLVLDPWPALVARVGVVGVRAGLRELVSARLRQSSGDLDHQRLRAAAVAGLDVHPVAVIRAERPRGAARCRRAGNCAIDMVTVHASRRRPGCARRGDRPGATAARADA